MARDICSSRSRTTRVTTAAAAWTIVAVVSTLSAPPSLRATTLVVGAKNFAESAILAELMAQTIESQTDASVTRRLNLAGTQVCFEGLRTGEIDLYAEYTGTGLRNILGDDTNETPAGQVYSKVAREFARRFDIEWLAPFGFENTYVLLMRREHSAELGLRSISDLADHPLRYGITHEFLQRADGMPGLRRAYRLNESATVAMAHDLSYQALAENSVDVIDGYSTDAKIVRHELTPLRDDQSFFPPYEAAPVIRDDVEKRVPGATAALRLLAGRIGNDTMRRLNFQVEVERRTPSDVAASFLKELGIDSSAGTSQPRRSGFWSLFYQRRWATLALTQRHLALTGGAVALACLIGIPLGIAASRRPTLANLALGLAGTLQTIPSIALLAFMLPLFGIGTLPALVALLLYAILPILRNTVTGLRSVDERLIDVGRGLGMRDAEILQQVELPIAAPFLMAGIRTATVISVGTATLAAFIGAGGLGDPIVTGLSTTDYAMVLCGALPAALLATGLDGLLGAIEAWATPKGLRSP